MSRLAPEDIAALGEHVSHSPGQGAEVGRQRLHRPMFRYVKKEGA